MQLKFQTTNLSLKQERFLAKAFFLLADRLAITRFDNVTVLLTTRVSHTTYGAIGPALVPVNVDAMRAGQTPTTYEINLTPGPMMLVSLSHEMKHLQQWLYGELRVEIRDGFPITLHEGVPITAVAYEQRPYEVEAHQQMNPLTEWVLEEMEKTKCDQSI